MAGMLSLPINFVSLHLLREAAKCIYFRDLTTLRGGEGEFNEFTILVD